MRYMKIQNQEANEDDIGHRRGSSTRWSHGVEVTEIIHELVKPYQPEEINEEVIFTSEDTVRTIPDRTCTMAKFDSIQIRTTIHNGSRIEKTPSSIVKDSVSSESLVFDPLFIPISVGEAFVSGCGTAKVAWQKHVGKSSYRINDYIWLSPYDVERTMKLRPTAQRKLIR